MLYNKDLRKICFRLLNPEHKHIMYIKYSYNVYIYGYSEFLIGETNTWQITNLDFGTLTSRLSLDFGTYFHKYGLILEHYTV